MTEEKSVETEELDNWKPGTPEEADCRFDCAEDDEENDCCACCW